MRERETWYFASRRRRRRRRDQGINESLSFCPWVAGPGDTADSTLKWQLKRVKIIARASRDESARVNRGAHYISYINSLSDVILTRGHCTIFFTWFKLTHTHTRFDIYITFCEAHSYFYLSYCFVLQNYGLSLSPPFSFCLCVALEKLRSFSKAASTTLFMKLRPVWHSFY